MGIWSVRLVHGRAWAISGDSPRGERSGLVEQLRFVRLVVSRRLERDQLSNLFALSNSQKFGAAFRHGAQRLSRKWCFGSANEIAII